VIVMSPSLRWRAHGSEGGIDVPVTVSRRVPVRHAHWSEWFPGSEEEWKRLPMAERSRLAFASTGCQVAYPTWTAPVGCVHPRCQIARGEKPRIYLTNLILRAEAEYGWLRFNDRKKNAAIFRAARATARRTGIYDPWQMPGGWQMLVYGGL
jgi:hypothetical protein